MLLKVGALLLLTEFDVVLKWNKAKKDGEHEI